MLKGKLKTLELLLLDRIFTRSQEEVQVKYDSKKGDLVKALQDDLERQSKMEDPSALNSFGDYLRLFLEQNRISLSNASSGTNLDNITLKGVIENRILLSTIPPESLAKLSKNIHLPLDSASNLIEKSLRLFALDPTTKGAMARYSPNQGMDHKERSMKDGVSELMMRAAERRPFNSATPMPSSEEVKHFLDAFKKAFLSL